MSGWRHRGPVLVDVALAAVVATVTVGSAALTGRDDGEPDLTVAAVLLLVAAAIPLAWRRRAPVATLLATGAATAGFGIADYPDPLVPLAPLVALYTVVSKVDRRTGVIVGVVTLAVGLVATVAAGDSDAVDVYLVVVVTALTWVLGENQRTRHAYFAEVQNRAERAERDRDEEAHRAVAAERSRIARELHDVVAHHVSVMVVQAEAAASVAERDPSKAAPSFEAIATTGRVALAELRRLLGVLRADDDAAALDPQPGLAAMDDLVDQVGQAGLPVVLRIEGDQRALPPGVDVSAYRILQEALTNTLRHAGPARATVIVRYAPDALELEVSDDGKGPAGNLAPNGSGAGHGLVGMAERVALFGGTLDVGPGDSGGFAVRARLPTRG